MHGPKLTSSHFNLETDTNLTQCNAPAGMLNISVLCLFSTYCCINMPMLSQHMHVHLMKLCVIMLIQHAYFQTQFLLSTDMNFTATSQCNAPTITRGIYAKHQYVTLIQYLLLHKHAEIILACTPCEGMCYADSVHLHTYSVLIQANFFNRHKFHC